MNNKILTPNIRSIRAKERWARGDGSGFKKGNRLGDNPKAIATRFKKGQKSWIAGKEAPWAKNLPQRFQKNQKAWNVGQHFPQFSGKNHHNWKGGLSSLRVALWQTFEYRQWRSDIFERDNYICQYCHLIGKRLEAHHIKQLAIIIKENKIKTIQDALNCVEVWNINNGLTLCTNCHKKIPRKTRNI